MSVNVEIGTCAKCGQPNPQNNFNCRDCGAMLPWAATRTQQPMVTHGSAGNTQGAFSAPGSMLPGTQQPQQPYHQTLPASKPSIDYGPVIAQVLGGLIFLGGAALWIGNMTGKFTTFTGAGYLTMLVGGGIFKMGSSDD